MNHFSRAMEQQRRQAKLADRGDRQQLDQGTANACLEVIFQALRASRLSSFILAHARTGEVWTDHGRRHNLVLSHRGLELLILVSLDPEATGGNVLRFNRDDVDLRHGQLEDGALTRSVDELARRLRRS